MQSWWILAQIPTSNLNFLAKKKKTKQKQADTTYYLFDGF